MALQPTYRDEAVITLTAINPLPSMTFPRRRMFLSRSNNTIPIGRTSKRNTHYEAVEKNCWIDSAVMSRDHAELFLDLQEQRIVLRDIGSLHGTFVNTMRLSPNQKHVLQSGDILQFGVPIERGHATYQPCSFEAGVEFGFRDPAKRPVVFAVPEESDVDDLSGNDEVDDKDKDTGVEYSSRILRNNCIIPAPPDAREHDRSVIDLTTSDKISQHNPSSSDLEHYITRSDLSESRMPTPPETVERFEEDLMLTESEDDESDASKDDLFHDNESQAASADGSVNGDPMLPVSFSIPPGFEDAVDRPEMSSEISYQREIDVQPEDDVPSVLLGIERDGPGATNSNHLADVDEHMDGGMDEDAHTFFQENPSRSPLDDTSAYQWEMSKRVEARNAKFLNLHNGLVENNLKPSSETQVMDRPNKRKAEEISQEESPDESKQSITTSSNNAQSEAPSLKRFCTKAAGTVGLVGLGASAMWAALVATAPNL